MTYVADEESRNEGAVRVRRAARERIAAALGLLVLVIAVAWYVQHVRPVRVRLTITAGSREGLRHHLAERLAAVAQRRGVTLRLIETAGSNAALQQVNAGRLDLALVQGGLDTTDRPRVRQVAALKLEPLHLLVKAEIEPDAGEARGLEFLRGRVVNLGEPGSGTHDLALDVLVFAGLKPPSGREAGDFRPSTLGYAALEAETDRDRLPDAVFSVSGLPSPVVRRLVTRWQYRLVPLRFGEAFALDALHNARQGPPPPPPRGRWGVSGVDRVHVYPAEIPAYTYGVSPPVPARTVPTFGTRLLLVAGAEVNARAIEQLLEAGYASGPGGPTLDPAQLDLPAEFDWHDGAVAYRDRSKPLIIGDAVDFLEKWTSLLGGLLGGLFFLWQWARQRDRRRRKLGFESYMLKVTAIERRALQTEMEMHFDLKELLRLQIELSALKIEALERFADGAFEGDALFSGFVSQVNDARDHLTRLILHERESLEERAARQRRSSDAVWFETVGDLAHEIGPVQTSTSTERTEPGDGEVLGP